MDKLTLFAMFGGATTFLLGAWTPFMTILLVLIALDLLTGFLKGIIQKNLTSRRMVDGGIRKLSIFIMIIVANMLDMALFAGAPVIKGATITYYFAMESISIIENLGEMGVSIPPVVRDHMAILKKRTDKKDDTK